MSTTSIKRPYQDARIDAQEFGRLFPRECYSRWSFAGSLRRQRPEVNDVEHVVIPATGEITNTAGLFAVPETVNLLFHHLDGLVKSGTVTKHVYGATGIRWGEKYRGVDYVEPSLRGIA